MSICSKYVWSVGLCVFAVLCELNCFSYLLRKPNVDVIQLQDLFPTCFSSPLMARFVSGPPSVASGKEMNKRILSVSYSKMFKCIYKQTGKVERYPADSLSASHTEKKKSKSSPNEALHSCASDLH